MIIGKKLRELREQKGLLLRQVAAELEVDTAYISKMEQGKKNIKREFIIKLAALYQAEVNEIIAIWLADQILNILKDEVVAKEALNIVSNNLKSIK
jgi:HTH-type transcriptional regulator, competence development regulator